MRKLIALLVLLAACTPKCPPRCIFPDQVTQGKVHAAKKS